MKRVRVTVSGRVQGVFFRDSVSREAGARGVRGWVRNCSGGTVQAVFEGSLGGVDALVEFCRQGPEQAVVEHVDVVGEEPEGLAAFEVR